MAASRWVMMILAFVLLVSGVLAAESTEITEVEEALSFQMAAVARFEALVNRNRGASKDPDNLMRLVESLHRASLLEFKLKTLRPTPDSKNFQTLLRKIIKATTQIVEGFPHDERVVQAYLERARAAKELGMTAHAIADFKKVIKDHAAAAEAPSAAFVLADLLMEAKDYRGAIQVLNDYSKRFSPEQRPLVFDHLAWCHYNINELDRALFYLAQELEFYRLNKKEGSKAALETAAMVIAAGLEQRKPTFNINTSVVFLRKYGAGVPLDNAIRTLAFRLAEKSLEVELGQLVQVVDTLELHGVAMEHQFNRRLYPELLESVRKISDKITPKDSQAIKSLASIASQTQEIFVKEKGDPKKEEILGTVLSLAYAGLIRVGDANPQRVIAYHYNYAEIWLRLKKFDQAAYHFYKVVELESKSGAQGKTGADALVKAIASRYEALKLRKLIPETLVTRRLSDSLAEGKSIQLDPFLSEWARWVEFAYRNNPSPAVVESMHELARVQYAAGYIETALKRMTQLVREHPSSKSAVGAASRVLDTYLVSEKWDEGNQFAAECASLKLSVTSDFAQRLSEASVDTLYKSIEKNFNEKSYREVTQRVNQFLTDPNAVKSRRFNDFVILAANASLAMGSKRVAAAYFGRMKRESVSAEVQSAALLTDIALAEESYDFERAAGLYRVYLTLPKATLEQVKADIPALRQKALMVGWLSGGGAVLDALLSTSNMCDGANASVCDRFKALSFLAASREGSLSGALLVKYFKNAGSSSKLIWAVVGLASTQRLDLSDRLAMLEMVATEWEKEDALTKYVVLSAVSPTLSRALAYVREDIRRATPLQLKKQSIDQRLKWVKAFEAVVGRLAESSWARVKAEANYSIAQLYADLVKELRVIPAPHGLGANEVAAFRKTLVDMTLPFEGKAREAEERAFGIASGSVVDDGSLQVISNAYFISHPEKGSELRRGWNPGEVVPLRVALAPRVKGAGEIGAVLEANWRRALADGNFPKIYFLVQEGKVRKVFSREAEVFASSIALDQAGAQAEALAALDAEWAQLPPPTQEALSGVVVAQYFRAFNQEKTKSFLDTLPVTSFSDSSGVLARAAAWSGVTVAPRTPAWAGEGEAQ